jgi:hypothetical protein
MMPEKVEECEKMILEIQTEKKDCDETLGTLKRSQRIIGMISKSGT